MILPVLVPGHLLGDVGPKRRGIREIEVELQQIPQPHRLGPERGDAVTFGVLGMGQRELDDRGLQNAWITEFR